MRTLSKSYQVTTNVRGLAQFGYCRPTLMETFNPIEIKYQPTWCGVGLRPEWFPEPGWEGYEVWPGSVETTPDHIGPYWPRHSVVSWPTPPQGAWVGTYFNNTRWTSISPAWWITDHWSSSGAEVVISAIGGWQIDYRPTKIRVFFTGEATQAMSLRNSTGGVTFVSDNAYVSGRELDLNLTSNIGRLYLGYGNINVTAIEFYEE